MPTVGALVELNRATADLAIVGSSEVTDAANRFLNRITSEDYERVISGVKVKIDVRELLEVHSQLIGAERRQIIEAMRGDLLPPWKRRLPSTPYAATPAASPGSKQRDDQG